MGESSPWRVLLKFLAASTGLVLLLQLLQSGFASWTLHVQTNRVTAGGSQHRALLSPSSYRFVLNQPDLCARSTHRRPWLVALVPVAPGDRTSRDAIRKTWGGARREGDVLVLTVFFAGVSADSEPGVQRALETESRAHGDVVQMDFVDSYRNLTIKTLMMLHWLDTFCARAAYAMKVDADVFLNPDYLLEEVLRRAPAEGFITGSLIRDGRPRRYPGSKWFISEEVYPESHFPPYVSGAGYVFSADVARKVCLASRDVPLIPLEDVYVGLCLRAAGVRPVYAQSLLALRNLFEVRHLEYDRCAFAKRVLVNGFKPAQLLSIWADFSTNQRDC